ncbi:MAG: alpha/beta fold hydrolase [Snowella sp.]|nr:alpha/beta fold hydrolase [Snowella sp.]
MKITENTIAIADLNWFYREVSSESASQLAAERSPVVLLHGLPSQSLTWSSLLELLGEQGWRAIAPDWIGSGFSSKPEKREFAYTPEVYLQALGDFLTTLELPKISLIVQGFLASVGIQYALRHPEQIDRLIILNTPLTPTVKLPWLMQQWTIPFLGDMVTQDPLLIDRTLEGGSGFVISDARLDIYRKPFLTTSASGRALLTTTKNLDFAKTLTEIETGLKQWQKPTLLIWGMQDPWLTVDPVEALVAQNPQLELFKLPEAKHYPQEHWPQEIGEAVMRFLRR